MANHQVTLDGIETALGLIRKGHRKEFFIQAIRFLDGDLDEMQMIRFELRISEDPDLAMEFESLALLDSTQLAAFARGVCRPC